MFWRAPGNTVPVSLLNKRSFFSWTNCTGQHTDFLIDVDVYTPLLRSCRVLSYAKRLHLYHSINGFDTILYVQNGLLDMYNRCDSLEDVSPLFTKMESRDVFSWNVCISAHAKSGFIKEAFELFQQMWFQNVEPNQFTLVSILSVCNNPSALVIGEYMHTCIVMDGCENDVVVDTAIVNMYSKCGDLKAAGVMFEVMVLRNVYSWSAMIAAYAQHDKHGDALQLFYSMLLQGELPNKVTFISLLDACAGLRALKTGIQTRACIVGTEIESDVVIATSFVNMYAKCNQVREARNVFDTILNPNVITWNAMISAYAQHGDGVEAIKVYNIMLENNIKPNKATFVSVLDACASIMALREGENIHSQVLDNCIEPDVVLYTALVNMYGKCGCLQKAQAVFLNMPYRNNVSWNAIIASYAQQGCCTNAFLFFNQMQWEGLIPDHVTFVSMFDACAKIPSLSHGKQLHAQIVVKGFEFDVTVGTAIINMYGKCDAVDEARRLFDEMPEKNAITWSSMISAYSQHERGNDAFSLYGEMHKDLILPDRITCISILDVCAELAFLTEGQLVHLEVLVEEYESDDIVGTALVSLYGRCGCLEDARAVFNKISVKTAIPWNALIAGHAQQGHGLKALELFHDLQDADVNPTDVTFVSVLNACSHAGLVYEGWYWFYSMGNKFGIPATTDHYGCMVDLLGRAGLLDDAENLIANMPDQPTAVTWMSLLGACRHQVDITRAERAAGNLFRLDSENFAPFVMLSNMYATGDLVDGAACLISEEI